MGKVREGGDGSGKHGRNYFWDGFKKEWLECANEECKVCVSMRVSEGWKGGVRVFKFDHRAYRHTHFQRIFAKKNQ